MKNKISLIARVALLLALPILAWSAPAQTQLPGHLQFQDSTGKRTLSVRTTLLDSFQRTDLGQSHWQNSTRFQLRFDGQLSPEWTFHSIAEATTDFGDRTYPAHFYDPYDGLPYNPQGGGHRTWDAFSARTDWNPGLLHLSAGTDHLQWGPARRNKLVLRGSDAPWRPWQDTTLRLTRPAPIPFVGFSMELAAVRYTQYSGSLLHAKDKSKYLHSHRLDFSLPASIQLGVTETIIYGSTVEGTGTNPNHDGDSSGRSLELIYTLPFIPYLFAQHYVGDRDNTSMSADISIRKIAGWEFYGELFWDDMKSPTAMFDDSWWGNKWASTIGIAADKRRLGPLQWDWMAEFTHIEPWVYTHHLGASHRYTHFAQSLGSDLGPNAQEIYTSLRLEHAGVQWELHASGVAKDTARGGNINDIHAAINEIGIPEDRLDKTFLDPASTFHYQELGSSLTWSPTEYLWLRSGYARILGDYRGNRIEASTGLTW